MARPLSIFESLTKATTLDPSAFEGRHTVIATEFPMGIANQAYGLTEYDPNAWREMLLLNGVTDPFRISELPENGGFQGKVLRIPAIKLPDFTQ